MSTYLDQLSALTAELESLNTRVADEYKKRGLPPQVPIIAYSSDAELMQLAADWKSYQVRWDAFVAKYMNPEVDPHTVD